MDIQLLIRNTNGEVVSRHALTPQHSLSLKVPQHNASFEIHSSKGEAPKKIALKKKGKNLTLTLQDELTGEITEISIEDYVVTESTSIVATGADGVVYPYTFDAATELLVLSSSPLTSAAQMSPVGLLAGIGGTLVGGTALAATLSHAQNNSRKKTSGASQANDSATDYDSKDGDPTDGKPVSPSEENKGGTQPDNGSSNTGTVITDDNGNALKEGDTLTDNTPTLGGDGQEPGSTVEIKDGDTVIGEVVVDEDGKWSFTPEKPLNDGEHDLVVVITDPEGNETSDTIKVIVDTADEEGKKPDNGSDQGSDEEGSKPDNGSDDQSDEEGKKPDNGGSNTGTVITDDNGNALKEGDTLTDNTPTLGGDGQEPGSTVEIKDGDTVIGEVVVDEDGKWSFTPEKPLEDGDHELTVVITDPEGHETSDIIKVIVDTSGEDDKKPDDVINTVITDDEGHVLKEGEPLKDNTPTLGGDGQEPGSKVQIKDGNTVIGEVVVDEDGKWSFTPEKPLNDGEHELTVVITDPEGHETSDIIKVIVDTSGEDDKKPDDVINTVITDDEGHVLKEGEPLKDNTPTLGGDGQEPGSKVQIKDGNTVIGEVVVDEDGKWSFTPEKPLADGEHELTVVITDPEGHETSDIIKVIVDTSGEDDKKPDDVINTVITDDEGHVLKEGEPLKDNTPTLGGDGQEPGSKVQIKDGNTVIGEVVVDEDGKWSFTPEKPLADGEHELTVVITDPEGHETSDIIKVIVDTSGEDDKKPDDVINTVITDDEGHVLKEGEPLKDNTPTLGGDGQEPGSKVQIKDGNTVIGEVVVDEDGKWSFTPEKPLNDGEHELTVVITDPEGHETSDIIKVIVDTSGEDDKKPDDVINTVITDDEGHVLKEGEPLKDNTPTLGGDGQEPGSKVQIKDGNTVIGEVVVDEDGKWSFTPEKPLADGEHELTVVITDPEGHETSDIIKVIVDTSGEDDKKPDDVINTVITDDEGHVLKEGEPLKDNTPTLGGDGQEPGSKVQIKDGNTVIGEVVVDEDGKWSFTPEKPLADGEHELTVVITDPEGHETSDIIKVIVDTSGEDDKKPDDVINTVITDDEGHVLKEGEPLKDNTPTLGGDGQEPGSKVQIKDGNTVIGEVVVDEDGKWSFTPEKPLNDGEHELTVVITDPEGHETSDIIKVIVDTSGEDDKKPDDVINTVITDDEGHVLKEGEPLKDNTPTLGGDGQEPGSKVQIKDGNTVIGEVVVDEDGKWSFTPEKPLADGEHELTVVITDPEGHETSDIIKVIVDTSGEDDKKPDDVINTVITDDEGHVLKEGEPLKDNTPTLGGDGQEPGSKVQIKDGNTVIGEVVVDEDGKWSFTPEKPLADGEHELTVVITDPEGHETSDIIKVIVDTSGEDDKKPDDVINTVITDDEGHVLKEGEPLKDNTPTLGGDGQEPGSKVQIKDGNTVIGEVVVDEDGKWSFTPEKPLADGEHELTVVITDPEGHETSDIIKVIVDTSGEDDKKPDDVINTVITDDEGHVLKEGEPLKDNTPTLGGDGQEPGSKVQIKDGNTVIGEVVVDEDGKWSFTPEKPLADGEHELTVVITDPEGHETSDIIKVIVDTSGEDDKKPDDVINTVITDDEGHVLKEGEPLKDNTPTLGGDGQEPGSKVQIKDGNTVIGEVVVDEDGKWSFTPEKPLADGEHELTVVITDPEGHETSDIIKVIVDTSGEDDKKPDDVINTVITDDEGHVLKEGEPLKDNTPTLGGDGQEPGSKVQIKDGNTVIGEVVVDEDGKWSFTPEKPLADGEHELTVVITDPEGHETSDIIKVIVDTSGEDDKKPDDVINTVITDDEGHVLKEGEPLKDNTPTLGGDGQEPGSKVQIKDGNTVIGEVVVDEDGKWSFTPEKPLNDGEHELTVVITDPEGHETSETINIVIDTVAPLLINSEDVTLTDDSGQTLAHNSPIADSTPTFTAKGGEPGTTVIIRDKGVVIGEAVVDEAGSWSFTPEEVLGEGAHEFTFEAVDAAGNTAGESAAIAVTVDSVAPEGVDITTITILDETGEKVSAGNTLTDNKVTLNGSNLEAGTTVTLYDKGDIVGQTQVDEQGNWSFTFDAGLYDGTHDITFSVTDSAGNSSATSDSLNLSVKTVELSAKDNITSGASIGFTYDTSVQEMGTILKAGGYLDLSTWVTSDPIRVADGTIMDLIVDATSSSFLNIASNSKLVLQKFNVLTQEWEDFRVDETDNLFGMFGLGSMTTQLTISGLTAGQYRLSYGTTGLNIYTDMTLNAKGVNYVVADEATMTDYTTASGNVISDVDNINGSDGLPHPGHTTVTSVSVTNSDGSVTTVDLKADSSTTLVGKYGKLIIHSDGSYEYIPEIAMDNIGKVDSFTYTLKDAATGKTSSADIHVQIGSNNDNLTLSWDPTDPTASALTDIASDNQANSGVTVKPPVSNVISKDPDVSPGKVVYSDAFLVNSADDIINGSLTLTTENTVLGESFKSDMTITWSIQQQNSAGEWETVQTGTYTVVAGKHNGEQIFELDLSELGLGQGTYRVGVVTSGPGNWLKMEMNAEIVHVNDYDITSSSEAKGNFLLDEGSDGSVDKLGSIYTRIYAKSGDGSSDTTIDESYTQVTESGITLVGKYGTLVLYSDGTYFYKPGTESVPGGSQDIFTYGLKGANGNVVTATITINLGVTIDGSHGGELIFAGTDADDTFRIVDTDFRSFSGGEGKDTLVWAGKGKLNLDDIASKVSNIESVAMENFGSPDGLIITAESVYQITNEHNSLYIRGGGRNTLTLPGRWTAISPVVVDGVSYEHYTGLTSDGKEVNIFIENTLNISTELVSDGSVDGDITLVEMAGDMTLSAQDLLKITQGDSTLYVKGSAQDTITLLGNWELDGGEIYNSTYYEHYTSVTSTGETLHLYLDRNVAHSQVETAAQDNLADITGDVEAVSETVHIAKILLGKSSGFTSDSFTIAAESDAQSITLSFGIGDINAKNTVNVGWALERYDEATATWVKVLDGEKTLSRQELLELDFSGQETGTYRIIGITSQTGYTSWMQTYYDQINVTVDVYIASATHYVVVGSEQIHDSVLTSEESSSGASVKSVAVGVVSGAASYSVVTALGTTLKGLYGTLTIHQDGSYSYALNSNTVIKQTGSEDLFTYVLADGTVKNLTLTAGVAVEGARGGELTMSGTVGNDSFAIYDTHFTKVDGKGGKDTLIWKGQGQLQLADIADKVSSIEVIDLHKADAATLVLSAEEIVAITDTDNRLFIRGDAQDSLSLSGTWLVSGTEVINNITYIRYEGTTLNGTEVKLYVESGVQFNELPDALLGSLDDAVTHSVVSIAQNGVIAEIADNNVSLKGAFGTLVMDKEGDYTYQADPGLAYNGESDSFVYTLSDGSQHTLTIELGVSLPVAEETAASGTSGSDIFHLMGNDFVSINGGEGVDTLQWHGAGALNLSLISARVHNIEVIALDASNSGDKVIISAESLLNVTDENNTLYVKGDKGDTVTLNGRWEDEGAIISNGVNYHHYSSISGNGTEVQLYIEDDITLG